HAEDLVQEVFLRLWRQPERFDASRGSLQSFLLADAHGRAVDLVRSESSRARREMRAAGAVADSRNDPEAALVAYDAAKPVLAALATLTMDERRAIHLAYFGGFTYVEVAQLLGQPEGTVKSRIRAGLQRMRAELTD
ncbi:MAG: sigma-70 family RNA polymerase sigma factor, partial [Actinobacteria bacterium]|nr:sigma-70 family RNA polymerase sigma factor [Actinomycetota bacterium]